MLIKIRKWVKSPIFGPLETEHLEDVKARLYASTIILGGLVITLSLCFKYPAAWLSAIGIGLGLVSVIFCAKTWQTKLK